MKNCCINCKFCNIDYYPGKPCAEAYCKLHPLFDKVYGVYAYKKCEDVVDECTEFELKWSKKILRKIVKIFLS